MIEIVIEPGRRFKLQPEANRVLVVSAFLSLSYTRKFHPSRYQLIFLLLCIKRLNLLLEKRGKAKSRIDQRLNRVLE